MIAIPNMDKPKSCGNCIFAEIDGDFELEEWVTTWSCFITDKPIGDEDIRSDCPLIEIVTCKDCRDYETYALSNDMPTVCGFTIIESEESDEHNT